LDSDGTFQLKPWQAKSKDFHRHIATPFVLNWTRPEQKYARPTTLHLKLSKFFFEKTLEASDAGFFEKNI
jgi:hypothetical protein